MEEGAAPIRAKKDTCITSGPRTSTVFQPQATLMDRAWDFLQLRYSQLPTTGATTVMHEAPTAVTDTGMTFSHPVLCMATQDLVDTTVSAIYEGKVAFVLLLVRNDESTDPGRLGQVVCTRE